MNIIARLSYTLAIVLIWSFHAIGQDITIYMIVDTEAINRNNAEEVTMFQDPVHSSYPGFPEDFTTIVNQASKVTWIAYPKDPGTGHTVHLMNIKTESNPPNTLKKQPGNPQGNKIIAETRLRNDEPIDKYTVQFKVLKGNQGGRSYTVDPKLLLRIRR
jgi:hypothetical protein